MRKEFLLSVVIAVFMLVSMTAVPVSGQTTIVLDLTAARAAREQGTERLSEGPIDAMPDAVTDAGVIAYVRRSPHEIRLIQPDGTNDRRLWASPNPTTTFGIPYLDWRPDGRVLAFSSEHEHACSWYDSDVYTILANGTGLRRVTNAPDCAGLAAYPQGRVTVTVLGVWNYGWVQVYVQGSNELKGTLVSPGSATDVTFDHVADLGPDVAQPAVGIVGVKRYPGEWPHPDVQAGQTAFATVWIGADWSEGLATDQLSWRSDGSAIGFTLRDWSEAYQISPNAPVGSEGEALATLPDALVSMLDWAPTASKADQFLYNVPFDSFVEGSRGIYLTSAGQTDGGTQIVPTSGPASPLYQQFGYDPVTVHDLEWLPDGSGFLFLESYVYVNLDDPDPACMGLCTDVFKYDFAASTVTQVTRLGGGHEDDTARDVSISPDGQYVAIQRIVADAYDPLNATSSIWVVGVDGSGLHELVSDGWGVAWGPTYDPEPAHAEFVGTPTSGVRPLAVQFTNQSTGDYDTCAWTFGDGETSSSCGNPTHTYATKGVYTVALTVTGPEGTDTRTRASFITVNEALQADFAGSPTAGIPPLFVTFTNQSTGDYDTCAWTFGDGGTSSSCANPTHTYATEGTYTVALTVNGSGGADTRTRDRYIAVQDEYRVYLPLALGGH